jgi:hypothetical protein
MDDLTIPAFLRITQKRAPDKWRAPAASLTEAKRDWRRPKSMTDEEWQQLQAREAEEAERKKREGLARLAEYKERARLEREEIEAVKSTALTNHRRRA